jgi:hypothetical protein
MSSVLASINDVDSQLAVELASEISELKDILTRHGITRAQLRTKLQDPRFQHMFHEARRVWNSDLSVRDRIKIKSAVLVEDSLINLYKIFNDADAAIPARLDAFKSMAKVADVFETTKNNVPVGDRVSININLGDGRKPVVIEGTAERVIEESAQ